MPYLHLPVQSGSDRILAGHEPAPHPRRLSRAWSSKIRAARPDIALAGDFIVGFPGETDADFADTLSLVDEAGYMGAFTFKYSPRPGTPAATAVRSGRRRGEERAPLSRCRRRSTRARRRSCARRSARVAEVLFERRGREAGQIVGRSPWLMPVHVDAPVSLIGTIGRVVITGAGTNSFFARLPRPSGAATGARRARLEIAL